MYSMVTGRCAFFRCLSAGPTLLLDRRRFVNVYTCTELLYTTASTVVVPKINTLQSGEELVYSNCFAIQYAEVLCLLQRTILSTFDIFQGGSSGCHDFSHYQMVEENGTWVVLRFGRFGLRMETFRMD